MITYISLKINFYFLNLWAMKAITCERMEHYEWAKRMSFANEWTRERHLRNETENKNWFWVREMESLPNY